MWEPSLNAVIIIFTLNLSSQIIQPQKEHNYHVKYKGMITTLGSSFGSWVTVVGYVP